MLALRRWDPTANAAENFELPRAGMYYARQTTTALRQGRVIEVIRPVSVTLHETLHDPPCRVVLRQRWRIYAADDGTQLRLALRYELNQAATLRSLHWRRRLRTHCDKMLSYVDANLERARLRTAAEAESGASAQAAQLGAGRPPRNRR